MPAITRLPSPPTIPDPGSRQFLVYENWIYTYLVFDPKALEGVIIVPLLEQNERDLHLIRQLDLRMWYILETHVHVDHLSGAKQIYETIRTLTAIGSLAGAGYADMLFQEGVYNSLQLVTGYQGRTAPNWFTVLVLQPYLFRGGVGLGGIGNAQGSRLVRLITGSEGISLRHQLISMNRGGLLNSCKLRV